MSQSILSPSDGQLVWLGGLGVHFKLDGADTQGTFSVVEHPLEPGAFAPPHTHSREDEFSYVLVCPGRNGRAREPRFTGVDCRRLVDFLAQVRRLDGSPRRVRAHHVWTSNLSPVVPHERLLRGAFALAMAAHLREYAWMGIPRTRSHSFSRWAICPSLDALGVPRLDRVSSRLELAIKFTFLNSAMASSAGFGEVGLPDCSYLCPALPLPAYVKPDRAAADQVGRVRLWSSFRHLPSLVSPDQSMRS
jgi:hypothetical protein